jgi:hypothetical protein
MRFDAASPVPPIIFLPGYNRGFQELGDSCQLPFVIVEAARGMGIRFYCPNGHKLNVKAFLAGKRGICPQCEARFEIPSESQIPENAPKVQSTATEAQPAAALRSEVAVATLDQLPIPMSSLGPIAEAPEAVWYVRPPSGGQYGPAGSDVMKRWVDEGRVCKRSLVWREGWTDWKPAGPLFPESSDDSPAPALEPPAASPPPVEENPQRVQEAVRARRQSAGRGKSIAAVVFLGLLIVALLVMLVIVLQPSA